MLKYNKIVIFIFSLHILALDACKPQNRSDNESSVLVSDAICVTAPSTGSVDQSLAPLVNEFKIQGVVRFEELRLNRTIKTFSRSEFEDAFATSDKQNIQTAFDYWFKGGYKDINNPESKTGLRSESFLRKGYQAMRSKSPQAFQIPSTVYRGLKLNSESIRSFLQDMSSNMNRSSSIHLGIGNKPVWASASRRPTIAGKFAASGEYSVLLRINQRSGLAMESLSTETGFYHEREVLLPPEAKFNVKAINTLEKDGKVQSLVISLEEVSSPSLNLVSETIVSPQGSDTSDNFLGAELSLTSDVLAEATTNLAGPAMGFSLAGDCDVGLAEESKAVGNNSGKNAFVKSKQTASSVKGQRGTLSVQELQAVSENHIKEEVETFTRWLLAKPNVQKVMTGVGRTIIAGVLAEAIYKDLKEGNYKVVGGHVSLHNVAHSHVVQVFTSLIGAEMGASAGAAIGNSIFVGIGGFIGGFIGGIGGWELGGRMETWVANHLFPQTSPPVVGSRAQNYQAKLMASNVKIFMYPADRRVYLVPSPTGQGLTWAPTQIPVIPGWDIFEIVDLSGKSTGLKMIKSHTKDTCLMAYTQNKTLGLTTCDHARVNQQWKWDINSQNRSETMIQSVLDKNLCIDRYLNDNNEQTRAVGLYSCDAGKHNQLWSYGG